MTVLVRNKEAGFNYQIEHELEAGIQLTGQEVKSVKGGNASLKGSYVSMQGEEVFLTGAHIAPYKHAGMLKGYEPTRQRKLLLKKEEINSIIGKYKEQGMALFPLDMHTKRGLVKVKIGIGRGKKKHDKRETIKKREIDRKIGRALRARTK